MQSVFAVYEYQIFKQNVTIPNQSKLQTKLLVSFERQAVHIWRNARSNVVQFLQLVRCGDFSFYILMYARLGHCYLVRFLYLTTLVGSGNIVFC